MGVGGPDPPGKSQVIWVSIGNKQLDPPPPLEKVGPPLENVGPPLEPLKNERFFKIDHLTLVNKLRTKKKKTKKKNVRAFFVRLTWTPPPDENSWIHAWIATSDPYNTAWLASFYIRSYMDGHQ